MDKPKYRLPYNLPPKDMRKSMILTNGATVREFERRFQEFFNIKGECIAVNSCTAGLMAVLQGMDIHRPQISAFTFSATAHAAYFASRNFVLGDVDRRTFNMLPRLDQSADAILATHTFGVPCDVDAMREVQEREQIPLIFDAAHAIGVELRGQSIADYGDASVFSFSPTKQITCGEGGMIVSKSKELAERVRLFLNYGNEKYYDVKEPGINARMSEIHAATGVDSISNYAQNQKQRQKIIDHYLDCLPPAVKTQANHPDSNGVIKDLSILSPRRLEIANALESAGIETKRYFWPIHRLTCYEDKGDDFPNADALFAFITQLPINWFMDEASVEEICDIIKRVVK